MASFRRTATGRSAEFPGTEKSYPSIIRLRENASAEFVPFLRFVREIRTVSCLIRHTAERPRSCP